MSDLCTVWFAVVGVIVGMNFLGVLHSVRMVWLRLGDVSGWCVEWAVHSVICCRWCEGWNEFSWCSSQCAHGLVKIWWVAGVLNEPCTVWFAVVGVRVGMSFLGVLHSVRMVLLRFGDVSGCAEWAVPIVICCWWCEFWRWREIRFFCVPAVMAWVLGRWREIRPPPSKIYKRKIYLYILSRYCWTSMNVHTI